jgi:DNA polymerase I
MGIKHLVLDLETDSFDIAKAKVKVFGLYDIDANKYIITTDRIRAIDIIQKADFVITFNGKEYDLPILYNQYKLTVPRDKHIDLYQIFLKRQSVIVKKPFSNFKLKTIVKELELDDEGGKGVIDYNIFKKDKWTEEEQEEIAKYLKQDLLLTAKCWEYLKKRFEPFKAFMNKRDIDNYKYINTSMGAYTYKVVCNLCKLEEKYDFEKEHEEYEGAYVQIPKKEFVRGKVLCFDFASLYPMMYVHANLFSHHCTCCSPKERWDGGANFDIKGTYCKKQLGVIEKLIKTLYLMRKEYKKKHDEREQVVKIIINSLYGVSGSPIFSSLYNLNTAQDCTALGRQCIKYAIAEFEKAGFIGLYTDTDSAYVEVPEGKTEDECLKLAHTISHDLSNKFPFPWDEFSFKLECKIKYITFFKDDSDEFKKKNYIYVTEDDKLTIKGLNIVKKDCSDLSKHIFKHYIKDNIIKELRCKYDKKEVTNWIYAELSKDRELAAKQFSVKSKEDYKNETSIQAMIYAKYGTGEFKMIKNKRLGVGKGVKYCTLDESKQLNIQEFDISIFLKELAPFIKKDTKTTLGSFGEV